MGIGNWLQLLLLAGVWGGSFIFIRVVSPVIQPILMTDIRVFIAGAALVIYCKLIGFDPQWRRYWKQFFGIGAINCALPFSLYAFAGKHIPASYLVILNATTPLFGMIFSAIWFGEKFTLARVCGLLLGGLGVALVARVGGAEMDGLFWISVFACLLASACYGYSGIFVRKYMKDAKPIAITVGTQVMAGLVLLPLIPFVPKPEVMPPLSIWMNLVALALLGSALAYVLYYRLMEAVGMTKSLMVTFLMPIFGILWGVIFLDEKVTAAMLLGCLLIIVGTMVVLGVRLPFLQRNLRA